MFKSEKHTTVFDRAMKNIKYAVELKKKLNHESNIGYSNGSIARGFKDEILPFAKLATDLGVDYGVIKHCSDE